MKALRLHAYTQQRRLEEVAEPVVRARTTSSSESGAPACDAFADAMADLEHDRMHGRGVLVP